MDIQSKKIILNPNANLGRAWRTAEDLRPILESFGTVDWVTTQYPKHGLELARQAALDGYHTVIAAGGDGTVHEVINGLMQVPEESRPRLGVIPLGSGNDFTFAVGVNRKPELASRQIFNGVTKAVDIGCLRDETGRFEYFDNTVGIGFDTTVTLRSRRFTMLRGFVVYFLAVIQTILLNHDALKLIVKADQEAWDDEILMLVACNGCREGGGFKVCPEALPDDGFFHYAAIQKVSRPMMFRLLPEVMNGTHGRFSQVRMGTFRTLSLDSDRPMYIHTDGEIYSGFGTDIHHLDLEIIPGAIQVIV